MGRSRAWKRREQNGLTGTELLVGLVLAMAIVFFTTANAAMRHFSRVRLAERLESRGRSELLQIVVDLRSDLLFSTGFLRLCATLGLVLLVTHAVLDDPEEPAARYGVVFVISMVLVMLAGVVIPNAWARYGSDAFLARSIPVLLGLRVLVYPLLAFQHLFDGLVRRLAGIPGTNGPQEEADQIGKEILDVVSEGELAGAVHEEDAEMIESVMELRATTVGEIMTPRTEIVALQASSSLNEAKELIVREGHSRIPVYVDNLDDIKGVLYAKDLLLLDGTEPFDPIRLMRKVPFVPETKRVPDLLQELREQKVHLAIVLDEYGGTAGLITIEDILEEIVGEIADEYEEAEPEPIRRIAPNMIEVDARLHIDELNDELKIDLPEDEDYDTVGGFIFSEMGRIPAPGEAYQYSNIRFEVLEAEERKINRLRVEVSPDEAPAS